MRVCFSGPLEDTPEAASDVHGIVVRSVEPVYDEQNGDEKNLISHARKDSTICWPVPSAPG